MCSTLCALEDVVSLFRSHSKKGWFGIIQNLMSLCILTQNDSRSLLLSVWVPASIQLFSVTVLCSLYTGVNGAGTVSQFLSVSSLLKMWF